MKISAKVKRATASKECLCPCGTAVVVGAPCWVGNKNEVFCSPGCAVESMRAKVRSNPAQTVTIGEHTYPVPYKPQTPCIKCGTSVDSAYDAAACIRRNPSSDDDFIASLTEHCLGCGKTMKRKDGVFIGRFGVQPKYACSEKCAQKAESKYSLNYLDSDTKAPRNNPSVVEVPALALECEACDTKAPFSRSGNTLTCRGCRTNYHARARCGECNSRQVKESETAYDCCKCKSHYDKSKSKVRANPRRQRIAPPGRTVAELSPAQQRFIDSVQAKEPKRRQPVDVDDGKINWVFRFGGGGFNTVMARTKKEATKLAEQMAKRSGLVLIPGSVREDPFGDTARYLGSQYI